MNLANHSKSERELLLATSVDVWCPGDSGQLNNIEILHHWRGRSNKSAGGMITMLECARLAWKESRHSEYAFDGVQAQASRLIALDTFEGSRSPRSGYLPGNFEIAKAIAHVCQAAGSWIGKSDTDAFEHVQLAAQAYESWWRLGLTPYVEFSGFNTPSSELDRRIASTSVPELLSRAFGPEQAKSGIRITGSTYMILYELLSAIMQNSRKGTKTSMRGLFVGTDWRDAEHEIGHVLDVIARRLPAPVQSFYLDPLSLGVTLIDKRMRNSLRAAWRCCLFDCPVGSSFAVRIDIDVKHPQIGLLSGGSAGCLLAAMMCAARDRMELSSNLSATCTLKLSQQDRECRDSGPLDPHLVQLGPIHGAVPKLREAWGGTMWMQSIYMKPISMSGKMQDNQGLGLNKSRR